MIDNVECRPIEFRGEQFFGECHADGIGESLAERPGRGFNAGRQTELRVPGSAAMQLPKIFQLFERQVVTGQVQQCILQHRAMAVGQNKTVAIGPVRVGRVV